MHGICMKYGFASRMEHVNSLRAQISDFILNTEWSARNNNDIWCFSFCFVLFCFFFAKSNNDENSAARTTTLRLRVERYRAAPEDTYTVIVQLCKTAGFYSYVSSPAKFAWAPLRGSEQPDFNGIIIMSTHPRKIFKYRGKQKASVFKVPVINEPVSVILSV